jgi:hypothetical protein
MSLLLMLFYWLVIPGIAFLIALWLWRRAKDRPTKIIALLLIVPGFVWLAWTLYGGEKAMLDQQVRELCAKDGGIRVYETVKLPADKFNQWGNVDVRSKEYAKPTDEYYLEFETYYYRSGNPQVSRNQARIIRRSDGRILGESITYGRGGGDLPGPWHGTSFTCPQIPTQGMPNLENSVFLKGIKE